MSHCWLLISLLFLSSCATYSGPALQPEINSLVVADRMKLAAGKIGAEASDYGQGNYLLYYLDRGLVEYYAGDHVQSARSFEKARARFDELYTKSVSKEAASWVANDYMLPYRGADYEYVLINVFQALNYLALGNVNEALVDARDLDSKYQVIEASALKAKRRRFEDNGFARMFMGFLHEATGRPDDRDSARLFYQQAKTVYSEYYGGKYGPFLLNERLSALEGGAVDREKATVFVFQLVGFSPLKVPEIFIVPVDKGFIAQLAFPKFSKRYYEARQGVLIAEAESGAKFRVSTELGVSIEDLAVKDLESRKASVLSKAILRPALKYFVERKQKENVEKKYGRVAAEFFGLFSNLYNVFSEQADLRSWQTLPAEIQVARLELDPGRYHVRFQHLAEDGTPINTVDLADMDLSAGQTYFKVVRGRR